LKECINRKVTNSIPIWFMRQAGRYLPEFRKIRSENSNFIKLCLNPTLSKEITIQPLRRFQIDAAIIFSDILLVPYSLGQDVVFEKGLGPKLGELDFNKISNISDDQILEKLKPIYDLIKLVSNDKIMKNKDLIGFIGATWTLLVYMLNRQSPKKINDRIFTNPKIDQIIEKIIHCQKLHIKNQVSNGASIIQIFDSWAGLASEDQLEKYIYRTTKELVEYTKNLGVEVICFPRGIKSYKKYCDLVKPSAINIDYEVDPFKIAKTINIPIQGGMDPKCLLLDKDEMLKNAKKYLDVFKDHNYIFNLGHGMIPETNPENVKILVNFVKDFR
ncbi:uroporphyrinogen decarboxylase, partial [Candidatus Pelagibacter sp.]|nr:uroporphyrinogen decarboxylase [Candidatus Pelagibacter sp.]